MVYPLIDKIHTCIFLFFLCIFLLTAQGYIQTTDGTIMYSLTKSIVNDHSIVLDQGCNNELTRKEIIFCHSKYGMLISLLAIPFFLLGKLLSFVTGMKEIFATKFAVSMLNPFITSLCCLAIYKFARKIDFTEKVSFSLSLIYGLTTIAWAHSEVLLTEPLSTLFIFLTIYCLYSNGKTFYRPNFTIAGFFFACSILTKLANLINIVPVFIYILLTYKTGSSDTKTPLARKTINFLAPVFFAIFIIGIYNYLKYGSAIVSGYEGESFSTPLLVGLYGNLFSSGKSIFLFNPILIFSIPGFFYFYKSQKNLALTVLILFIINIILFSKWRSWMGGWSWGPRYLMLTIPFLIISTGYYVINLGNSKKRFFFFMLCFIGFLIQLSSVSVSYSRYYYEMGAKFPDDFMKRAMFHPAHSPIKRQFENTPKVALNLLNQEFINKLVRNTKEELNLLKSDYSTILKEGLSINVPNFWWVYAWLYGISKWLILSIMIFLLSVIIITGKTIFQSLT